MARGVHVVEGLHGVLEPRDAGALRDEIDDALSRQVPRAQLVADVATQASRVVAEAVAPRVGFGGRADGRAEGTVVRKTGMALMSAGSKEAGWKKGVRGIYCLPQIDRHASRERIVSHASTVILLVSCRIGLTS